VVRIATSPRIYRQPSTLGEVFAFYEDLTDNPNCELVEPGERHWAIFRRLCLEANITGPASPTPGTPPSPSSTAANGSRWTATSRGSRV
jgi:hypothetical protein